MSWRYAIVVGLGAAILIVVSFGPMTAEIGNLALVVWPMTAGIGALQCLLLAELTARFPDRAGGVAQFGYCAVPGGSPVIGAVSSWSYWFAWTPGIATHLILVVAYVKELFWPGVNTLVLACMLGLGLYLINSSGLRFSMFLNIALAVCSFVPLTMIMAGVLFRPATFDFARIWPLTLPTGESTSAIGLALLILKWTFVAAWAAYGAEMAATVGAEVRDASTRMPRALGISSIVCLTTFTLVPITLIGTSGSTPEQMPEGLLAFAPAAENLIGPAGPKIIGFMLICALLLSAQVFILGSSRTIYQMACDGHLPRPFRKTTKRGAPVGSMLFDVLVIVTMLAIFGTNVVNVVAAAAIGYLVVFVLLPLAYLVLRRYRKPQEIGFRLGRHGVTLAVGLLVFNLVVLIVGGSRWGAEVMGVGLAITLLIVPVSLATRMARRRAERKRSSRADEFSRTKALAGSDCRSRM